MILVFIPNRPFLYASYSSSTTDFFLSNYALKEIDQRILLTLFVDLN